MGNQLLAILVFFAVAVVFAVVTTSVLGRLLRPRRRAPDEPSKEETYECGESPIGPTWVRFNPRFYTLALVFLLFDVEVALLYPWAVAFRRFREGGAGPLAAVEAALFLGILGAGLLYCARKGDLDWLKPKRPEGSER